MTYKLRDETPGFHHVGTRGNNKRDIFLSDDDRAYFLLALGRVARRHGWTIYAYALMRNHYHLVVRIDERGLARGMCELNTDYALWFNQQNGRINHLFGRRYWSEYLPDDKRLLNAIRYDIQNPRRAGKNGPLESHVWTSYAATIGLALARVQLARDDLLLMFSPRIEVALEKFREFCESPAPEGHVRWQPP